jgi:hydrogenase maturation protease
VKTVIIGLGNPILTDDSVGIRVSRLLKKEIHNNLNNPCEVIELYTGGIRLMDAMIGYDKAIIIDAIVTNSGTQPGTIYTLTPSHLMMTKNSFSSHDTNLVNCLKMGEMLNLHLPSDIKIWAIEADDVNTFSEELTEKVEKSVPKVACEILHDLGIEQGEI